MSRNCGNSWPYNRERDRLSGLWREPFNHLTRHAIHDFRSFSCLCRGPCSPSRFTKLVRPYQASVLYAKSQTCDLASVWFSNSSRLIIMVNPRVD